MRLVLLILFFFGSVSTFSQKGKPVFRNKSIIGLPVVFRFPETGWGGGLAGTASWEWAQDDSTSSPSQASIGLTYTQNKQVLAFLPFQVFLDNNTYYLNADIGWFKYNFYYYGIGEGSVPEERYDVKFPRVRLLASRRIAPQLYLGLRVNYEEYTVTSTTPGGELESGKISGGDYSRTSALGPAILRDTRDYVFYPRKGIFGELSFQPSLRVFGGDRNFSQLVADLSWYRSISPKLVLASNYFSVFSFGGDVPFSQLAQLGGPRKMRGIYQGFFRDKNTLLLQAELRWEIWKFVGMTAFGSSGFLGNEADFLRLGLPKFTYGVGLRLASRKHLNVRLDYGLSPYAKGNFYATIGEAF